VGELQVFLMELFPALRMFGIFGDAVHRADGDTLRCVEVANAFGATPGIDDIDLNALGDGLIGALRLADIAIDALVGDHQRHGKLLILLSDSPDILAYTPVERPFHFRVDKLADIAAQSGDLTYQAG
jgi:hypothetical protein